jgi:hypothetical protein
VVSIRRLAACGLLLMLMSLTVVRPAAAEPISGSLVLSAGQREELMSLSALRSMFTNDIADVLSANDRIIDQLYSFARAVNGGDAAEASGWKQLVGNYRQRIRTIRAQLDADRLQTQVNASRSMSESIRANALLTPAQLLQGIDQLAAKLDESLALAERNDPRWLDFHRPLGDYYLVLQQNADRYNIIAGEATMAVLLEVPQPYVVRFTQSIKPLPTLPTVGTIPAPAPALPLPVPGATSTGNVVESRIDGTFNGWTGDTIFTLENGQIWQQSSYAYHYHYAYRPKVLIYPSGSVYKMHVDGVDDDIQVKQLK